MIDITITSTYLSYQDSVIGTIDTDYDASQVEQVDNGSIHLITDRGVLLVNIAQYIFNGQVFTDSTDLIIYIQTLE